MIHLTKFNVTNILKIVRLNLNYYNYKDVQQTANSLFGETFNWVDYPNNLINIEKDAVYSAVGYFYFRLKKDIDKLNNFSITKASYEVNGGYNGLEERKEAYSKISTSKYYNLKKCKN